MGHPIPFGGCRAIFVGDFEFSKKLSLFFAWETCAKENFMIKWTKNCGLPVALLG